MRRGIKQKWFNWRSLIIDDKKLPFYSKGLALYLNTYMNDSHDMAWPSVSRISSEMSVDRKTVIKYLDVLAQNGYLTKQKRFGKTVIYHARVPSDLFQKDAEASSSGRDPLVDEIPNSSGRDPLSVVDDVHSNKQDNKQDNKQERAKPRAFVPPDTAMVAGYLEERGITEFTAEQFCDFYESKGWMVGKNKMKDWKAAIRTWEKRRHEESQRPGKQRTHHQEVSGWIEDDIRKQYERRDH